MTAGNAGLDLPYQLPVPIDTRAKRTAAIAQLSRDIDALEQKLQEASKVRQTQFGRLDVLSMPVLEVAPVTALSGSHSHCL